MEEQSTFVTRTLDNLPNSSSRQEYTHVPKNPDPPITAYPERVAGGTALSMSMFSYEMFSRSSAVLDACALDREATDAAIEEIEQLVKAKVAELK